MPPPSLSSSTIVSFGRARRAASRPPTSWASATSPSSSDHRPARGGGDAERGRDRAVDPVGAAVGEHARRRRRGAGKNVSTSRTGIEEAASERRRLRAGARRARRATRGSLSPAAPSIARDRRARRRGRRAASARARRGRGGGGRRSRRAPRASAAGRRASDRRDRAGRVLPGALGVERDLQRVVEPVQPLAQRLGGRQVADAERRGPGACAAAQAGVAQQRVVVGDRRRAAARAGQRVGEQRDAGRARRTRASASPSCGSRSARPATSTARGRVASSAASPSSARGDGSAVARGPRDPRAPAVAAAAARVLGRSGSSSTSGSRSEKFRCTGPGRPSSAVQ